MLRKIGPRAVASKCMILPVNHVPHWLTHVGMVLCNVRTYSITALGTAAWVKHDLVTFLFNGMYVFVFNSF